MPTLTCEMCGASVRVIPSRAAQFRACSRSCQVKLRHRAARVRVECPVCGAVKMLGPTKAARFVACGTGCANVARAYPREFLIERLQWLARKIGKTPGVMEITIETSVPSHSTYQRHFGSIVEAQRAAGLEPLHVIKRRQPPQPRNGRTHRLVGSSPQTTGVGAAVFEEEAA